MGKRNVKLDFDIWWPERPESWGILRRYLMPHPGTLIMTLLLVGGLLWAGSVGAIPLHAPAATTTSTGTIAYQGRLADSAGTPITETVNMEFRLYDVADGGAPLWSELWTGSNAVRVSDGLFNVMLGSLEPIPQAVVAGHDQLWLGITVGTDEEMTPRVQLGSVPFAVQALTVPDGSISTAKIADGAVTPSKAPNLLETRGNKKVYTWIGSVPSEGKLIEWPERFHGQPAVVASYWGWTGDDKSYAVVGNPPGTNNMATGAVVKLVNAQGNYTGGYVMLVAIGPQ